VRAVGVSAKHFPRLNLEMFFTTLLTSRRAAKLLQQHPARVSGQLRTLPETHAFIFLTPE
jgi:hypothetical protein